MLKFILVLQLCYSTTQVCIPPIQTGTLFNTHKECSLMGYKTGFDIISNKSDEEVNTTRAYIKFWCLEQKVKDEKKIEA